MTDVNFGDAGAIITEELSAVVREEFVGGRNNLIFQTIEQAHEYLRAAGEQHDYAVESVIDSLELTETDERGGTIAVRFGWSHPQADRYEWGTTDHTIRGNPILSFVWEERHDPPEWVRAQFDRERSPRGRPGYRTFLREVDVSGIKEIRFARRALDDLQRALEEGGRVR